MPLRPTRTIAALAVALAALSACGDPFQVKAAANVQADTLVAYATTGTPRAYPVALVTARFNGGALPAPAAVIPLGAASAFDLAFDVDAQGRPVLIPAQLVVSDLAGRRVGFDTVGTAFDDLTEAPRRGYQYDSLFVVRPGQTVAIESTTGGCSIYGSPELYARIVIDSVQAASRRLYLRIVSNPNCGFRELVPGRIPTR